MPAVGGCFPVLASGMRFGPGVWLPRVQATKSHVEPGTGGTHLLGHSEGQLSHRRAILAQCLSSNKDSNVGDVGWFLSISRVWCAVLTQRRVPYRLSLPTFGRRQGGRTGLPGLASQRAGRTGHVGAGRKPEISATVSPRTAARGKGRSAALRQLLAPESQDSAPAWAGATSQTRTYGDSDPPPTLPSKLFCVFSRRLGAQG